MLLVLERCRPRACHCLTAPRGRLLPFAHLCLLCFCNRSCVISLVCAPTDCTLPDDFQQQTPCVRFRCCYTLSSCRARHGPFCLCTLPACRWRSDARVRERWVGLKPTNSCGLVRTPPRQGRTGKHDANIIYALTQPEGGNATPREELNHCGEGGGDEDEW